MKNHLPRPKKIFKKYLFGVNGYSVILYSLLTKKHFVDSVCCEKKVIGKSFMKYQKKSDCKHLYRRIGNVKKYDICGMCGKSRNEIRIERHHENYNIKNSILFLCHVCHRKIHKK